MISLMLMDRSSAGGHPATMFEVMDLRGLRRGACRSQMAIIAGADKYAERVTCHCVTADSAIDIVAWTGKMAIDTADADLQIVNRVGSIMHFSMMTAGA